MSENLCRHTDKRDPQYRLSAGRVTPSCHLTANSRGRERGSLFAVPTRHIGSRYAPYGSVDHRASPPAGDVEEGMPGPVRLSDLVPGLEQLNHVLREMLHDIDHESGARRACDEKVHRLRVDRSADQPDYADSKLKNERGRQGSCDELSSAFLEIG